MKYTFKEIFEKHLEMINANFKDDKIPVIFTYKVSRPKGEKPIPFKLYSTQEQKEQREKLGLPTETNKYRQIVLYMNDLDTGERREVFRNTFVYNKAEQVLKGVHVEALLQDLYGIIMKGYFKSIYYNQIEAQNETGQHTKNDFS